MFVRFIFRRGFAVSIGIVVALAGCSKKEQKAQEKPLAAKTNVIVDPVKTTVAVSTNTTNVVAGPAPAATSLLSANTVSTNAPVKLSKEEELFEKGVAALTQQQQPDPISAAKFFREAAELGHAPSQQALGALYLNGDGVDKDYKEGMKWLEKSAAQNFPEAIFKIASVYARGIGVEPDINKAAHLAMKAAELGHIEAEYNVGAMYSVGRGLDKNEKEAAKWFAKAAEAGHPTAQSNLGVLYATGKGVQTNMVEAVKWFRRAAEQGQPTAAFNYAQALSEGKAVPQDLIEAYKWYTLSAEQGDKEAADQQAELGLKLSPAQVAEGIKRASSFRPKAEISPIIR